MERRTIPVFTALNGTKSAPSLDVFIWLGRHLFFFRAAFVKQTCDKSNLRVPIASLEDTLKATNYATN